MEEIDIQKLIQIELKKYKYCIIDDEFSQGHIGGIQVFKSKESAEYHSKLYDLPYRRFNFE